MSRAVGEHDDQGFSFLGYLPGVYLPELRDAVSIILDRVVPISSIAETREAGIRLGYGVWVQLQADDCSAQELVANLEDLMDNWKMLQAQLNPPT